MIYTQEERDAFLRESNAIEGVFDEESFEDSVAAWEYLIQENTLNKGSILEAHALLMKRQGIEERYKGHFRDCDVYVGDRKGVAPAVVSLMIGDWAARTMNSNMKLDSKRLHVLYEYIHPFIDGNGRTGRMFMNWTRVKLFDEPILIIKADERGEYYKWFK